MNIEPYPVKTNDYTIVDKGKSYFDTYKTGYKHGEDKTIDRVLEIITETEKYEKKLPTPNAFGFRLALEQIKQGVEAMKEGGQE